MEAYSLILTMVKNTFAKVFINLAKELNTEPEKVQLELTFPNGACVYKACNDYQKVKDENGKEKQICMDDYCGSALGLDLSGGTQTIATIINQSGVTYANELKCDKKEVRVILGYKQDSLPLAGLMRREEKIRTINIEKEFFGI